MKIVLTCTQCLSHVRTPGQICKNLWASLYEQSECIYQGLICSNLKQWFLSLFTRKLGHWTLQCILIILYISLEEKGPKYARGENRVYTRFYCRFLRPPTTPFTAIFLKWKKWRKYNNMLYILYFHVWGILCQTIWTVLHLNRSFHQWKKNSLFTHLQKLTRSFWYTLFSKRNCI